MFRRALMVGAPVTAMALSIYACGGGSSNNNGGESVQNNLTTATPIKHVVVIYNENVSFDHYFGSYPNAANPAGEPAFTPAAGTPAINGLSGRAADGTNGNFTNPANGVNAANPFRLDRTQASSADQNHAYIAEQEAYDNGAGRSLPGSSRVRAPPGGAGAFGTKGQVMGYYDGNTVGAMWNYAQKFAMSDNAYTDTYGPSTPGALEVVSGQTNGMQAVKASVPPVDATTAGLGSYYVNDGQGGFTMINDVDPVDTCSPGDEAMMTSKNIGDLLNAKSVTWGGFMGGFNLVDGEQQRHDGLQAQHDVGGGGRNGDGRLRAASQLVPVFRQHGEPEPHAPELDGRDRLLDGNRWQDRGTGESPVRHGRLLREREVGQLSVGELPEGAGLPGRSRRLLGSARRTGVHHEGRQLPAAAAGLGEHGRDRCVG